VIEKGAHVQMRFFRLLALLAVLAGVFAGVAKALDFDDEDPVPPHPEVGLVYHYEIGTHAGCLPHHVIITSGELPPGLKLSQLNDHTALVDGIATESGTFSAWMAVKDCENKSAEALFTFESYARRWGIATASLPAGAVGSPYSAKITGQGIQSNVTYAVSSGSLPAGLALSGDGTLSGTPTAPASSTFTVTGTAQSVDPAAPGTRIDSHQYTLTVSGSLTATLAPRVAEVGVPVQAALTATGGTAPYVWSAAGALPARLQLAANGTLSGVPSRAGTYTLTAHVTDGAGTAKDVQVALVVRAHLAIGTRAISATAGHPLRVKLRARGGVGPLRWSARLPRALKVGAATGTISGIPAKPGTYRVTVRARDALGAKAAKTLLLVVR
jgi:large repetitive protein